MSIFSGVVCFFLGGGVAASLGAQPQGASGYTLAINEFMTQNESTVEDPHEPGQFEDWLEIYNYGNAPIDIGGFYLTDDLDDPMKCRIPPGFPELTTVPARGYLLIWADSDPGQGALHVCMRLSAQGEDIGLFAPQGTDLVLVDGFSFSPQGRDQSQGRLPDGASQWETFRLKSDRPPTPGQPNRAGSSDQTVIINEIMYHPLGEDDRDEYLELYNRGAEAINLTGWRFTQGISFTFDEIVVEPGDYLVVAADVARFLAMHPDVTGPVVGGWQGKLSNKGETIKLVNGQNATVDTVTYHDEGAWAQRVLGPMDHAHRGWQWHNAHDGEGESLELVNPELSNDDGQNWDASLTGQGTPGAVNSVYDIDTAPIIRMVTHTPAVPHSADEVTVSAEVFDNRGRAMALTLYWRVDESSYAQGQYPSHDLSSYSTVPMTSLQNGQYVAVIPTQTDQTIVEFYVAATDGLGKTRTYPAPSVVDGIAQQVTNLLYQVDDASAANVAAAPGGQPLYRLVMTRSEHDRLALIGDANFLGDWWASEAMSKAEMNGTFISMDNTGTQVRYNIGVRNRGNRSRFDPPMNYHVSFRHDQPWQSCFGLNLNSKYTHCQVIASAFYRMAGLAAQNVHAVQLRVNGVNPAATDPQRTNGVYAAVQVLDGLWAQEHAPDDPHGNLYRCTYDMRRGYRTYADLTYQGRDPANYWENYHKQTNEEMADWSDIFDLTYALNDVNTSDWDFFQGVEEIIDVEQWARFLAADTLVGNREKGLYSGMGDDYTLYSGAKNRAFWLVPHDLDTVLGQGDEGYYPEQDILSYQDVSGLHRLMNHAEFKARYYDQLRDLTETIFVPEVMHPLIDELLGYWVADEALNGAQGMKQFVIDRLYHVRTGPNPQVP